MSEPHRDRRVVIRADADAIARRVAKRLIGRLETLTERTPDEPIHLCLTGGGVGIDTLRGLRERAARAHIDWSRVHAWWGDERFLPAGDADRNDTQARDALLDHVAIPSANVHAMASSDLGLTAEEGADAYARELARFAPAAGEDDGHPFAPDASWPSFDVCLLGVGPDGHIASLFPDRPEILVTDRAAVAVHDSPKPPPVRISLTRPVLNSSRRVWLVLAGAEKASALGLALAGANYASVPAAGARARGRTLFFVDEAAARDVPTELIEAR